MRAATATAALLAGALAAAVTHGAEPASNVNAVRSNDGLGHWIYVIPVNNAVTLPGSSRAREYPGDQDRADAILGLSCRAGESPITAWLTVDIGPGEPDALTFFDNPVKALWLEWRDRDWTSREVRVRKPPLLHEICDEPPHFRRGFGHGTGRTDTTEGCSASNRSTFSTSGHRRPFPSRCAERGGRNPQEMAVVRQRGVFDVVQPHACDVAQADRCGAGWRPVSTMQRCVQTHRRRGSAPGRDRDAQGC